MSNLRELMGIWNNSTYSDGLDYCLKIDKQSLTYKLTVEALKLQGLNTKIMNGYSVQGLPYINELGTGIVFSEIFWNMTNGFISPAYYIASIVEKCIERNITDKESIAGIVGRGLRALPSFFREVDLARKMSLRYPDAEVSNGPDQDVKDHTDIMINNDGREYRIWSYQCFDRGLQNTSLRFMGKRGVVPAGYHVLCPIDIHNNTETEEYCGWCFYSDRYVDYICEMIFIESPDDYETVSKLADASMWLYLKKANSVIKRS